MLTQKTGVILSPYGEEDLLELVQATSGKFNGSCTVAFMMCKGIPKIVVVCLTHAFSSFPKFPLVVKSDLFPGRVTVWIAENSDHIVTPVITHKHNLELAVLWPEIPKDPKGKFIFVQVKAQEGHRRTKVMVLPMPEIT
ncbi:MAG: hypothetical protein UW21_C0002G0002 [Candidatus Woesebacteria bacterium GW2011_GWB1_44_11b]|uniref:Uncharacterized protein n=1 Tax=Candidatus Woesebacteria bacterium GW2011_GWB1_44_11b TaxID=1618580 RepID=A0A0G1JFV2_9BACT|nr:MAG: hypothetical protein UW21_C0002G0002 [Candidatus Woesebacteria bacterium GW2011_GWB1_44_11b]